jgi:hypothetical protein
MTLQTYSDLTAAIGNWLQRSDLTAMFPNFVTLFESEANRRLRVRQQQTLGDLTPSGGIVALPADYLSWTRLTWAGTPTGDLDFAHSSWLLSTFPNGPAGIPRHFTIIGNDIVVRPVDPDNTTLELEYFQKIPSLQANSTNWLMTEHPDLYLFGALTEAQAYTVNAETAALWKARRDELFDEIEKLSNKSRGPGTVRTMGPTP